MNKKDLVDIVSKKERKIEIAKIHEILDPSPDLVLFHAERSRLKPPSPSKDIRQGAKGHRRRRLGSLLFRRESIHVPASTIHIRRKKKKKGGGKYRSRAHRVSKQERRIPTWKKILRNVGFVSHLASVRRISKCFFINSHLNDFRLPSSLSLSPTAHLLPSPPRLNTFLRLNKAPRLRRVIRGETTARRTTMFRRRRRFSPLVGNYLPSGNKLKAKQR